MILSFTQRLANCSGNPQFWKEMKQKLRHFYISKLIPFLFKEQDHKLLEFINVQQCKAF